MARSIGLVDRDSLTADEVARLSRAALDSPLAHDAELAIARVTSPGILVGAFQRGASFANAKANTNAKADAGEAGTVARRGTGGPSVCVGEGTLYVALRLARPDALVACDPPRLLNRYVRPVLRALTKAGASAAYGGREFIAVDHRPAGLIAFAYDATTGRAHVEAFVAVRTPFVRGARLSFLAKTTRREPGTLESIVRRAFDDAALIAAAKAAFASAYDLVFDPVAPSLAAGADDPRADPPWTATCEEAIGEVAAGRDRAGVLRVGGDFMAARDAIARLEAKIAANASEDDLVAAIDDLARPDAALFGVRTLASFHDVVSRAR